MLAFNHNLYSQTICLKLNTYTLSQQTDFKRKCNRYPVARSVTTVG